jgi:hypothetical protein
VTTVDVAEKKTITYDSEGPFDACTLTLFAHAPGAQHNKSLHYRIKMLRLLEGKLWEHAT